MTHTLVVVGYTGGMRAYLDVPEQEAIRRYCEAEGYTREQFAAEGLECRSFAFVDEFTVYAAWGPDEHLTQGSDDAE